MKVLIIGSGGREHALAWKVSQSSRVKEVLVAPGNAGTQAEPKTRNVAVGADDVEGLLDLARKEQIDLTIVGPEVPLTAGVVDRFSTSGLACFGPTAAAARLEGSKAFCKSFMQAHRIPTAQYESFEDLDEAVAHLATVAYPTVVKADGLAAGKGVVIAEDQKSAEAAVRDMLSGNAFGEAGHTVVVEDFLVGEEASFIVMCDGKNVLPLASSQDHKARDDGDAGPNTGGMGAYSPAPAVTPELHDRIMNDVIMPVVDGMAAQGTPFVGFLYAGVMISPEGVPNVLEFNVRFGDPETQPVMMRLKSDLAELCLAALDGRLSDAHADWDERACLGVVMAAGGYPASYEKGQTIKGLSQQVPDTKVFHAGTARSGDDVVTAGGRVLCVCALGDSVADAQRAAYGRAAQIQWDNVYFRTDIGHRAINR